MDEPDMKYVPPGGPADVKPGHAHIEWNTPKEKPEAKRQKINGKLVVGNLTVMPDDETEWLAAILKCNCPAKAGLEVFPLSQGLRSFAGMDIQTVKDLIRQQGWSYRTNWEKSDDGKTLAEG